MSVGKVDFIQIKIKSRGCYCFDRQLSVTKTTTAVKSGTQPRWRRIGSTRRSPSQVYAQTGEVVFVEVSYSSNNWIRNGVAVYTFSEGEQTTMLTTLNSRKVTLFREHRRPDNARVPIFFDCAIPKHYSDSCMRKFKLAWFLPKCLAVFATLGKMLFCSPVVIVTLVNASAENSSKLFI